MAEEMQLRKSRKEDLPQILAFIEKNDFTKRSPESWAGEKMEACLAVEGKRIVGAFPFAKRKLKVAEGKYAIAGHASAVAVEQELRGKGIGSKIISFFKQGGFPELECVIVNRIDQKGEDHAYKWYRKNGFRDMVNVRCLFAKPEKILQNKGKNGMEKKFRVVETKIDEGNAGSIDYRGMLGLFEQCYKEMGGFEKRGPEFWKNRFRHHYYKEKNEYWLLELFDSDGMVAYAIIGKNSIHNETKANVLEYAIDWKKADAKGLACEISSFCIKNGIPLIRFVTSDGAKACKQLLGAMTGFEERDSFKIMALELRPGLFEKKAEWEFFDFDYI